MQISRASGPIDLSLEVLGHLVELLVREPVLNGWTPVLNDLAARAQPQNQNWEILPGTKPILRTVRRPLKGELFQPGLAPGYVRWFLLSGHAALKSSTFWAAEMRHPIPRIRAEVADLFREVAETEILPKVEEIRAKALKPTRKTSASRGTALAM